MARRAISVSLAAAISDDVEEIMNVAIMTSAQMHDATRTVWDAVVIGAGPAGAVAAIQFAKSGLQTLLVDAKQFPRDKVCGGYLNSRALQSLRQIGLAELAEKYPESDVRELHLISGQQRIRFTLPAGRVICRNGFDAALVDAANDAGVTTITGVQAGVEPKTPRDTREVTLAHNGARETIRSRVVVCADGLGRMSVRHLPEFATAPANGSRVGIGAVVSDCGDTCRDGKITMVVSRHGYVGISRSDANQLNIAAAVAPAVLAHATPGEVVETILAKGGAAIPIGLYHAVWRGTPQLTSRPWHVASERVFLVGDASGYVEPFTGEGMAAAIEAAAALTPFVFQATKAWVPNIAARWETLLRQIVHDRQHTCRTLAWILRRPWATFATISTCRALPGLAAHWISKTTSPSCPGRQLSVRTK
jgi:flavin-dependent dehydrogenase